MREEEQSWERIADRVPPRYSWHGDYERWCAREDVRLAADRVDGNPSTASVAPATRDGTARLVDSDECAS